MGLGALTDGLAPTPPMGWNSWNRFGPFVSDQLLRETADALIESGMDVLASRDTGCVVALGDSITFGTGAAGAQLTGTTTATAVAVTATAARAATVKSTGPKSSTSWCSTTGCLC